MDKTDIERYQILLQENPRSKIFAPLADAYRKMGMLNEAAEVSEKGIEYNPDFAGGHVVMARVLMEKKDFDQAIAELRKATELAPENILAHLLLAENYIAEKQSKLALKAYKMVLFLNPQHERARRAIQKLESLTADEFEDDLFSMKKLSPLEKQSEKEAVPAAEDSTPPSAPPSMGNTLLDRHLSLVDAFVARNESDKARLALEHAESELGPLPEILKRKQLIFRNHTFEHYADKPEPLQPLRVETRPAHNEVEIEGGTTSDHRLLKLEKLLDQFEAYRVSDNSP